MDLPRPEFIGPAQKMYGHALQCDSPTDCEYLSAKGLLAEVHFSYSASPVLCERFALTTKVRAYIYGRMGIVARYQRYFYVSTSILQGSS